MKIPFDIKYRLQIESGEYKVKIRDGRPARIICWEAKGCQPIIVLIRSAVNAEEEVVLQLCADGRFSSDGVETLYDLFIVTPEEELSEFEHRLCEFVSYIMSLVWYNKGLKLTNEQIIKGWEEDILTLAKQQLLQSGELLTQEHHEKLMETQYNETLEGVKKNWRDYFTPQAVTDIYNAGRNDVLKDLPRWKRIMDNGKVDANGCHYTDSLCLIKQGWYRVLSEGTLVSGDAKYLSVADLEKLPGFKEDESHE